MRTLLLSLAAVGMAAAPVAASAAPLVSTAAASSTRASASMEDESQLRGGAGNLFAFALFAGIISIVVIAIVRGDDEGNGNGGGNTPTSP